MHSLLHRVQLLTWRRVGLPHDLQPVTFMARHRMDMEHGHGTWLEDAGIPSRVIDELMGHSSGRHAGGGDGSPMGRVYRETTPAMLARVVAAIDQRLLTVLQVASGLGAYPARHDREARGG